jgi:carbamoyltransferase
MVEKPVVLGVLGFGKNPAACLVSGGRVLSFVAEERLNRQKGSHGQFPARAARWCLETGGIDLGDVDAVAYGWDAERYPFGVASHLVGTYLRGRWRRGKSGRADGWKTEGSVPTVVRNLFAHTPSHIRTGMRNEFRQAGIAGELPPVEFVNHHLCHAASAYWGSGFDEALAVVIDGSGEDACSSVFVCRNGELKNIETIRVPDSLGWYYAAFTAYLGFQPYRHEGKLMGLAAYGAERSGNNPWVERLKRDVLDMTEDGYTVNADLLRGGGNRHHARFGDNLCEYIRGFAPGLSPIPYQAATRPPAAYQYCSPEYVDLAWAVQECLEEAVAAFVEHWIGRTGTRDVCLAGGVSMNCKMNGSLRQRTSANRLFVHPAASDDGAALGAALVVSRRLGGGNETGRFSVYLGPENDNDSIRGFLETSGIRFHRSTNIAGETAKLLAEGKIVGWFQGRCEAGARALGARSILADPSRAETRDVLNRRVKYREPWRPFAPSMDERGQSLYLEEEGEYPHMTIACHATEALKERAPAVVHVDGTVRPQTVLPGVNRRFWECISEFGEKTGTHAVLNTSLNLRGQPIAADIRDAFCCFAASGMDALAAGDYLCFK